MYNWCSTVGKVVQFHCKSLSDFFLKKIDFVNWKINNVFSRLLKLLERINEPHLFMNNRRILPWMTSRPHRVALDNQRGSPLVHTYATMVEVDLPLGKGHFLLIDDRGPAGPTFWTLRGPITGRGFIKTQSPGPRRVIWKARWESRESRRGMNFQPLMRRARYIMSGGQPVVCIFHLWEKQNWYLKVSKERVVNLADARFPEHKRNVDAKGKCIWKVNEKYRSLRNRRLIEIVIWRSLIIVVGLTNNRRDISTLINAPLTERFMQKLMPVAGYFSYN